MPSRRILPPPQPVLPKAVPASAKGKTCGLAQQQIDNKSRHRLLAIELKPSSSGLQGVLVLPFGLALDKGVTLKIDDGAPTAPLPFRTCLFDGCRVTLAFD